MKKDFPLSKVSGLLQSGPVLLVSTAAGGRNNVMAMSWHTMLDFDPPLVGCVIAGDSLTAENIRKTKQCALNVPTLAIAAETVACGSASGRKKDKFASTGLTPVKASEVTAPLVKECWANLECVLADASLAKKYDMFVFKVVKAHVDVSVKRPKTLHHRGGSEFMVAGPAIKVGPAK